MIPRMNLYLGKGLKVSEDLEKYYDSRESDSKSLLRELKSLQDRCFGTQELSKSLIEDLIVSLDKFLIRIGTRQKLLSDKHCKKIRVKEENLCKLIYDYSLALKAEVKQRDTIEVSNIKTVVERLQAIFEVYCQIKI